MHTLIHLGIRVPADVKMVGVDDVSYAKFLPTPLTTLRQNCAEIGAVAMDIMLERLQRPKQPAIDVRVQTELVIRASSGVSHPGAVAVNTVGLDANF
jgi:DNA-binding LacI/PurR family transcriptional regulator